MENKFLIPMDLKIISKVTTQLLAQMEFILGKNTITAPVWAKP